LISPNSLQGQLTQRFFDGRTDDLDAQIRASLNGLASEPATSPGKKRPYPIGTVAEVGAHGKTFYLLAMADLNEHGNAQSSSQLIDEALARLWCFVAERGDLGELAILVLGTGRGRIELSRTRMIENIAQSFVTASRKKVFANKLSIMLPSEDAREHNVNLFQIKDYLMQTLRVH
jgi:hypothetical protein